MVVAGDGGVNPFPAADFAPSVTYRSPQLLCRLNDEYCTALARAGEIDLPGRVTPSMLDYAMVMIISLAGAAVSFFNQIRMQGQPPSWCLFFSEMLTGLFAGAMFWFLCLSLGVYPPMAWLIVGLGGHMGGRGLLLLERKIIRFVK